MLGVDEIVEIAMRIGHKWKDVALLTKQFEIHEINDIDYSRVNDDETSKARKMLTKYNERLGTRQQLVKALSRTKLSDLAKKVETRYFVEDN